MVELEHYIVSNLQIDLPIVIDHYFSFLSSQKDRIPSLSYYFPTLPTLQHLRKWGRSVAETDGFGS